MILNRRDLFRGMAAVGVASALGCRDSGNGRQAQANTLNVIFHGPFIFFLYSDRVEAVAAEVAGHVYGTGNWKQEYAMPKLDYQLDGLTAQTPSPSNEDKKIRFANLNSNLGTRYCKVILPKPPAAIVPLGWVGIPGGVKLFKGNDADGPNNVRVLGSSHACVYYAVPNPTLSNTYWKPEPNGLGAFNLHFIATPFVQQRPDHPVDSFAKLTGMLPSLNLYLDKDVVQKTDFDFKDPACSRLQGVLREEQAPVRAPLSPTIASCEEGHHLIPPRICDAPSLFVTM